ncbi:bile acid:sodium symporter family protein [Novosphingobium pentaromativorans]|uniref:Bile acid:sodium symporter n=1 Tax=Novosphingobium pentaromativorans US6-1 TaxID=1088721 RepID=G6EIF8_9SPHN|nr:bile acid:sodium symporter family protein [Novosphingobium pentaromativorans]AIT78781.1 transporter [Novosphingobium pentaromativorans US6-1]EHJ58900.1 bile acid:sodium symporter [Novosphingobium pentaromativorans US6-1]
MMDRVTRLFALWTVLGVTWAWFVPDHFIWVADGRFAPFGQPLISVMLGVIMLGMGLTLSFDDFRRVLALPSQVLAGAVLQFTIMPLAGFAIAWAFGLEAGLAVGLILVACCPGGTASNVVCYLARANVALSVSLTMVSTLVAIVMTPLLTGWLAGVFIEIDRWNLFRGMVTVVLLPVIVGVLMNRYLPRLTKSVSSVSPVVSVLFVVLIVSAIIAQSKALIEAHANILLAAVFTLHAAGFGLGYGLSRMLGLGEASARTISVEVGMQNSGLGASLASTPAFTRQFANPMQAALAPVPAAISAVLHVLIGSFLASLWSRRPGQGAHVAPGAAAEA